MEVYLQGGSRKDIHGTDPQFLIEKILRERIYESLYWKKELLGCTSEIMVDRGSDLRAVGGSFGNQKPTEFICCVLKMLQLQPELEIVLFLINQRDEKYLTCLACFYLRLTQSALIIYKTLEPLLEDKRKIRKRLSGIIVTKN
jgi:pre-mRNA-splicing factor 38A